MDTVSSQLVSLVLSIIILLLERLDEITINIITSIITLTGIMVALLIALFQDHWRKKFFKPKFHISDDLNIWKTPDKENNDRIWHRLKIQNNGVSTSHETIVKILRISKIIDGKPAELSLSNFPFPKTLIWGSFEGIYFKDIRPNEFEFINLFYTQEHTPILFFPYQNKDAGVVKLNAMEFLDENLSAMMLFYTNIYSDDLAKTQILNIKFIVSLDENNNISISDLSLA